MLHEALCQLICFLVIQEQVDDFLGQWWQVSEYDTTHLQMIRVFTSDIRHVTNSPRVPATLMSTLRISFGERPFFSILQILNAMPMVKVLLPPTPLNSKV